jgi:hypothetical protein
MGRPGLPRAAAPVLWGWQAQFAAARPRQGQWNAARLHQPLDFTLNIVGELHRTGLGEIDLVRAAQLTNLRRSWSLSSTFKQRGRSESTNLKGGSRSR